MNSILIICCEGLIYVEATETWNVLSRTQEEKYQFQLYVFKNILCFEIQSYFMDISIGIFRCNIVKF